MAIDAGKIAEYHFASEVMARDLVPCWPSTALFPFDVVVASRSRAVRVQVKATEKEGKAFSVSVMKRSKGRMVAYTPQEVEFVAVYLFELSLWYIIPIRMIRSRSVYLKPEDPKCPYAKFKNAWELLA